MRHCGPNWKENIENNRFKLRSFKSKYVVIFAFDFYISVFYQVYHNMPKTKIYLWSQKRFFLSKIDMYDFSAANEHNCIDSTNKYIKLKKNAWKVMLQIGKKNTKFCIGKHF